MQGEKLFRTAYPFLDDVLGLPVKDVDKAVRWYSHAFGLVEVERRSDPVPAVIMERDGVRVGFAVNGGVPENDGAAILVTDVHRARREFEGNGVKAVNWGVEERDGQKLQVFFVVAPDGLCFHFHQPIEG